MKVLVINTSLRPFSPVKLFPIGLGYVMTAMKRVGFDFDLLDIDAYRYSDAQVEKLIRKKEYDVICMGCIVTGYRIIKSLAALIKLIHPKSKIIVGNSVATSIVDILLSKTETDIAVMGEGDETIVELLKTISENGRLEDVRGICFKKDGKIIKNSLRQAIKDISVLPSIDLSIFDIEIYIEASKYTVNEPLPVPREQIRSLQVNTSRGCIASCSFCYQVFKGYPYRFRNADSVINEIKKLIETYAINYIVFSDELTFFSKKQLSEFLDKILASGLSFYWAASCRGNLFTNEEDIEIIKRMKKSGCVSMSYSLESADPDILKMMKKHVGSEQFSRQTKMFAAAGLPTVTSLVLGYPQETPETIRKTIDCCIENKLYPSVGYLLPQPGSEMYDYALEHGIIKDQEEYLLKMGDRQDLLVNFTKMSNEEFQSQVLTQLKRCNESLQIGLDEKNLIKTLFLRSKKK
ncbi:MAG: radical SAM protein [Candidatus Omnitrophota bacterium]|jgi:radical SAM superfamily enzyme YgiQ (UPF0313 family)